MMIKTEKTVTDYKVLWKEKTYTTNRKTIDLTKAKRKYDKHYWEIMKVIKKIMCALLIFSYCTSWAQASQETQIIIDTAKSYYQKLLPSRSPSDIKLVKNYGSSAVVSLVHTVPAINKEKIKASAIASNFYLYLTKDSQQWQVKHYTGALQTGIRVSADYARNNTAAEIVKQIEQKQKIKGVPEYRVERMRQQYLLATSLDEKLIEHFHTHKADFDALKSAITTLEPRKKNRYWADYFPKEDMLKHFNNALIEYVDYIVLPDEINNNTGCRGQNCFTLTLAFSPPFYKVGYFYLNKPEQVPQMSIREYLVIYPLGDGWYFFRLN